MNKGLIYIFTGDGKGKTSAALGVATRAICAGMKVAWVAWYKEDAWPISEKKLPELLPIEFYLMGKGFYIKSGERKVESGKQSNNEIKKIKTVPLKGGGLVIDDNTPNEHRLASLAALEKAKELLESQKYDLLVCDELCNALDEGLLTNEEVGDLIHQRKKTHLVLTGRNAGKELVEQADLVSEIKKIKHPYDKGIKAMKGLDF